MNRGRHNKKTPIEQIVKLVECGKIKYVEDLPNRVIQLILKNQVLQGNKRDINVFIRCPVASKPYNGFDWDKSSEGFAYWCNILRKLKSK